MWVSNAPKKHQWILQIVRTLILFSSGWSTVLLNSIGQLFAVGVLNAERFQMTRTKLSRLSFPSCYPTSTKERYEPSTAIRQYSVGRLHVLGLADDGTVWEWVDFDLPARYIKSAHVDMVRNVAESSVGCVTRVTAGMSKYSHVMAISNRIRVGKKLDIRKWKWYIILGRAPFAWSASWRIEWFSYRNL